MNTNLTRPKIFTFDFFGTVIDWRKGFLETAQIQHQDFDRLIDVQGRMEQERFRPYREIVAESLLEVSTTTRDKAEQIGREVGYFPLYPDSKAALYRLMKIAPCAATTNSDLAHKAQILERLGYLSGWTCAEEVRCYKPALEFFQRAKERLGIEETGPSWWHVSAYADYDLETAAKLNLTRVFVNRSHARPGAHELAVADLGVLADLVEALFPKTKSFEYKILDSRDAPLGGQFKEKTREALEKYLAALGREGWEIESLQITEHGDRLSFMGIAKREVTEAFQRSRSLG